MRQVPVNNLVRQVLLFPFLKGGNLGSETLVNVSASESFGLKGLGFQSTLSVSKGHLLACQGVAALLRPQRQAHLVRLRD